jgi:hypothetical protein
MSIFLIKKQIAARKIRTCTETAELPQIRNIIDILQQGTRIRATLEEQHSRKTPVTTLRRKIKLKIP